jgi:Sel1 repeat
MSRLPPLTISSLNQGRPGYFRSASAEATTPLSPTSPGSALKTEVETPGFRPVSVYPTVSDSQPSEPPVPLPPRRDEEEFRGRKPPHYGNGFFGARREQSPPSLENDLKARNTDRPSSHLQPRPSVDSMRQRGSTSLRPHDGPMGMSGYDSRLAPPRSPFAQRASSPRSMSESSDDDLSNTSNPRSNMSPHRKFSSGSGVSTSPISPQMYTGRSPSMSSEISIGGTRLPRPAFNFSRPLSRASLNGLPIDIPTRQASGDSQPSFILADDTAHTPVSMHSEGFPDNNAETGAAPSYVYSKFSLPRGKMLQRNSSIFQEGLSQSQYSWEQPVPFSNVQPFHGGPPPSPPSRPSTSSLRPDTIHSSRSFDPERPSLDPGRPSLDPGRPSFDPSRPSLDPSRPSTDTGRSLYERGRTLTDPPRSSSERPSLGRATTSTEPSSPSAASSSTLKARSQHSLAPSADLSPEEHVSRAIEYHEAGALNKSTYHLRLAARQNDPTGMLLYALACRHGWGMRPNQREGVAWLRKAADSASLEVADDEDLMKEGKAVDLMELKARKAQFALSIYELGVSHMNGWGIEQDKVLALRCFEIAGCKSFCDLFCLSLY